MNQLARQYVHTDHTRVMKDVRKRRATEIVCKQIFHVGFCIQSHATETYHHAVIIADEHGSFINGIALELNSLIDCAPHIRITDAKLVFVRNMMLLDPELRQSADAFDIPTEILNEVGSADEEQYLVFGMVGNERICLIKLPAESALHAIDLARSSVRIKHKKELLPLEVCLSHPVTTECYAMFDAAAERIKALISDEFTGIAYVH